MAKPTYSYIKWLPRNRIILATTNTLLNSSYVKGIFNKDIYGYQRDDNKITSLPALSLYHGRLSAPDNYDQITGNITINCYYPLVETRSDLTENVDTALETIRITIQNIRFHQYVTLNMFDYNKTMSQFQNEFDKKCFLDALRLRNPLRRYGFEFNVDQPTIINLADIGDCQKISMNYKYVIGMQGYYEFLDMIGIDGYNDPNRIVYPLWEEFYPDIESQHTVNQT